MHNPCRRQFHRLARFVSHRSDVARYGRDVSRLFQNGELDVLCALESELPQSGQQLGVCHAFELESARDDSDSEAARRCKTKTVTTNTTAFKAPCCRAAV